MKAAKLERVLEPEVMDSHEEARDYDAMDHSLVNRAFVADFLAVWTGDNPLLDAGTGTALIPIELCRQAANARIVAVDMAQNMIRLGEDNVRQAGFADRLTLACCDAKHLPHADAAFAAVISNSIVHHIPEPLDALREMSRVLKAGGLLFVRDLLRPADQETLAHLVTTYAGDANAHQRQMFADSLHAALSLAEVRHMVARLGYDPVTVRQTTDRHWTWQTHKGRVIRSL